MAMPLNSSNLHEIPPPPTPQTVLEVLDIAREYVREYPCDEIVIVMQRVDGTQKPWFTRDRSNVATAMFLLQTMLFQLQCMVCGIRLG